MVQPSLLSVDFCPFFHVRSSTLSVCAIDCYDEPFSTVGKGHARKGDDHTGQCHLVSLMEHPLVGDFLQQAVPPKRERVVLASAAHILC